MRNRCGLHRFIKYVPSHVGSVHSREYGRMASGLFPEFAFYGLLLRSANYVLLIMSANDCLMPNGLMRRMGQLFYASREGCCGAEGLISDSSPEIFARSARCIPCGQGTTRRTYEPCFSRTISAFFTASFSLRTARATSPSGMGGCCETGPNSQSGRSPWA